MFPRKDLLRKGLEVLGPGNHRPVGVEKGLVLAGGGGVGSRARGAQSWWKPTQGHEPLWRGRNREASSKVAAHPCPSRAHLESPGHPTPLEVCGLPAVCFRWDPGSAPAKLCTLRQGAEPSWA